MLSALKNLNSNGSGQSIWVDRKSGRPITPHGLRATFRTWGEDVGFPRELLEEALGHQVGTAGERAYRRPGSLERRRPIMQASADYCCTPRPPWRPPIGPRKEMGHACEREDRPG